MFAVICILMALLVLAVVAGPMLRGRDAVQMAPDVDFYKRQLAEIDRDVARDVLDPDEAARARVEIARRLLAADKERAQTAAAPQGLSQMTVAVMALVVFGIAGASYLAIGAPGATDQPLKLRLAQADQMRADRPGQAALEAAAPAALPVDAPADYLESVEQLRVLLATRPDDQKGWELLAFHESELRNYAAAAKAQAQVIAIKGDTATVEDGRILADLMVAATNGLVSPEAETVVANILDEDPENTAGRYYLGLLYSQTGRPDLGFRIWRPLVETSQDSFHIALARAQIAAVAEQAGVKYTAPDLPGPSAEQIAASEDMTEADRTAMIEGMVAGLADRLATEGGGPAEWARLISAYGVLGDTEAAASIWVEAADVFGADPAAIDVLREAARSAGVIE